MSTLKEVESLLREVKKELREVREENKEKDIVIKTLTERLSARTDEKSEWIKKYNEKSIDDCVAQHKVVAEYFEKYLKDKELIETFEKQKEVVLNGKLSSLPWTNTRDEAINHTIDKEGNMPKVGSKVFSYSKKGKEEAKKYAKKTGKKMNYKKK